MVVRLPRCCKGYFGRDCQGEGASYHLGILIVPSLRGIVKAQTLRGAGSNAWLFIPPLRKDPKAVILKSWVAFLLLFPFVIFCFLQS